MLPPPSISADCIESYTQPASQLQTLSMPPTERLTTEIMRPVCQFVLHQHGVQPARRSLHFHFCILLCAAEMPPQYFPNVLYTISQSAMLCRISMVSCTFMMCCLPLHSIKTPHCTHYTSQPNPKTYTSFSTLRKTRRASPVRTTLCTVTPRAAMRLLKLNTPSRTTTLQRKSSPFQSCCSREIAPNVSR